MLVHIKELFQGEVVGKFAYPAFNTMNLEITKGIIAAAEQSGTPVILQTSEGAIKYAGLKTLYGIMASLAQRSSVPIALHMDHGKDMEQLKHGIELGYSSVMIDHSSSSFEQNVSDTKNLVEFAHSKGAWVQGEIGKIRGSEDWVSVTESEALLTDPEEALEYYQQTGVDTLACSFGTIHGIIKITGQATPQVDIDRIRAVHKLVNLPLVLHGASGLPEEVVSQAIGAGIAIINIDTELRIAFTKGLKQSLIDQPQEVDPRNLLKPAIQAVTAAALNKFRQFKTTNLTKA